MIVQKPHLCTRLEIWWPKYHTASGEMEVWLSRKKVGHASPIIIVEFTKAEHLKGQRFCVRRWDVEQCPIGTNGKIDVYKVPFSLLEDIESPLEDYDPQPAGDFSGANDPWGLDR